ncbi:glyoxalase [Gracilaria domingensis]|nr:glyoxalase [Gracilaria domingensis]
MSTTNTGKNTIHPYLTCGDATAAIEFYKKAFGAKETFERWIDPKGKVGHAELKLGSSTIFVADANEEWDTYGPGKDGRAAICLFLDVTDIKETVHKVKEFGGQLLRDISEVRVYGCRDARIKDPDGHIWTLSQQVTHPSHEEMEAARIKFQEKGDY